MINFMGVADPRYEFIWQISVHISQIGSYPKSATAFYGRYPPLAIPMRLSFSLSQMELGLIQIF